MVPTTVVPTSGDDGKTDGTDDDKFGSSTMDIIVIASLGGLLIVMLVVSLTCYCVCRRRQSARQVKYAMSNGGGVDGRPSTLVVGHSSFVGDTASDAYAQEMSIMECSRATRLSYVGNPVTGSLRS